MATAGRYTKCLRLIEKWPLDPTKAGRDLGTEVREWIFKTFPNGEATALGDVAAVDRNISALSRIIGDNARRAYSTDANARLGAISASSMQCRQLISTEAMAYFEEQYYKRWWRRMFLASKKHPTRVLPADPTAAAEEIKQLRLARWKQEPTSIPSDSPLSTKLPPPEKEK